jgi:uncharacterized secreted protein with C-terminal beta-propeller domain
MAGPSTPTAPPSSSVWLRALAAAGGLAIVAASIVLSTSPVAAAGLERFASCDELRAHLEQSAGLAYGGTGRDDAGAATTVAATPTLDQAESAGSGDGGTNTQVAGIDELDIVESLQDGRILAVHEDRVLLVDAAGTRVLATLAVPAGSQITVDDERSVLWAVGTDWQSTTLVRSTLDGDAFTGTASWSVAGRLVDLRRAGGTVHLVAVDEEVVPMELGPGAAGAAADTALPFAGTSPVACDDVLHSPLPGGPATTLVATFTAAGELAPVAATEIVGAGDNVLVTDTALYVSTPSYDGDQLVTGIHRFDLDGLALTGSGSVAGRLLDQFSLDEHAGHLRAAVTVGEPGVIGLPMPVEPGIGIEGSVGGAPDEAVAPSAAAEPPATETTLPTTTEPSTTTTLVPTTITTDAPTTTTVAPTTTSEPTTTTTAPQPTTVVPPVPSAGALNEIVTFDLDGALDVVGRSPRFGHDGETLHGIRFAGDVAYAVTFLQTDPLYVIDVSEPSAPRVLGEVEVPGFSAYLHPISATQVVGFGPGPEAGVLARLFDVSDPAAPRLLDTVPIATDSPIVYDHHALRADGDRLLVAANEWVAERPSRCGPVAADQARLEELLRQLDEQYRRLEGQAVDQVPPALQELQQRADDLSSCVYPSSFPQARIVTLAPTGTDLQASTIETDVGEALRVLPLRDGYLVVGPEITRVGSDGATAAVLG